VAKISEATGIAYAVVSFGPPAAYGRVAVLAGTAELVMRSALFDEEAVPG
jgi:hypothetical protein